jgi:hypothetical protein
MILANLVFTLHVFSFCVTGWLRPAPQPHDRRTRDRTAGHTQRRALQNLCLLDVIDEPKLAALVAELVSTDPNEQWTFDGDFEGDAADAFCEGVIAAAWSGTGFPSLTDLQPSDGRSAFAKLLAATPIFLGLWYNRTRYATRNV